MSVEMGTRNTLAWHVTDENYISFSMNAISHLCTLELIISIALRTFVPTFLRVEKNIDIVLIRVTTI